MWQRRRKRFKSIRERKLWGIFVVLGIFLVLGKALSMVPEGEIAERLLGENYKELFFSHLWNRFYPAPIWEEEAGQGEVPQKNGTGNYVEQVQKLTQGEEDPAYRTAKAAEAFFQEHRYLEIYGGEETGGQEFVLGNNAANSTGNGFESSENKNTEGSNEQADRGQQNPEAKSSSPEFKSSSPELKGSSQELTAASGAAYPGKLYSLAQLEDYDFLMKNFYNVHTSTTADRELMDVKKFLSRDFRLEKEENPEENPLPQILIYHTHSQEAFADSQEGETIVAVGDYLAQCLTEQGFSVYHDSSAYDVRAGELDRNKAYQYALEGVTKILEENPSIQVVIDLHRDGVGANTRLVTEINGKPTAQIMFFNGMSQTPDGPIAYLENPYREDNLSFSLQLQLKASAWYPGLTRKIYLKGLRYNLHLRPRSCLIEVGAQTSTYQEARNAMEPLADIFSMVLLGK